MRAGVYLKPALVQCAHAAIKSDSKEKLLYKAYLWLQINNQKCKYTTMTCQYKL